MFKFSCLVICIFFTCLACTFQEKSSVAHNNELNLRGYKFGNKPGVSFRKINNKEFAIAVVGMRRQPSHQIEDKFRSVASAACASKDWKLEGSRGLSKTESPITGWEMSGKVICLNES